MQLPKKVKKKKTEKSAPKALDIGISFQCPKRSTDSYKEVPHILWLSVSLQSHRKRLKKLEGYPDLFF